MGIQFPGHGTIVADSSFQSVLQRLKKSRTCPNPVPLKLPTDFKDLLIQKYLAGRASRDREAVSQNNENLSLGVLTPDAVKPYPGSPALETKLTFSGDQMQFNIRVWHGSARTPDSGDTIRFVLNKSGQLLDDKGKPIQDFTGHIRVQSVLGLMYGVDLDSLFFADPLHVPKADNLSKNPSLEKQDKADCTMLDRAYRVGPLLKATRENDGDSSLYIFGWVNSSFGSNSSPNN